MVLPDTLVTQDMTLLEHLAVPVSPRESGVAHHQPVIGVSEHLILQQYYHNGHQGLAHVSDPLMKCYDYILSCLS